MARGLRERSEGCVSSNLHIAPGPNEASLDAMAEVSLAIMEERNKTEREIKRLAESGFRDEAWKLLVKHLDIKEPRTVKK